MMNLKQSASPARTAPMPLHVPPIAVVGLALACLAVLIANSGWMTDYGTGWGNADSMLRLVQVREFLDGKGWYDLTLLRMAPPSGVPMPWSRLVDVPIAAIIFLTQPFVGRAGAELIALNIWPPLLVVPFGLGLASIAHRFGGQRAALLTLVLLVLSPDAMTIFRPGRIDPQNMQAVLVVWMIAGLVRADQGRRWPVLAGAMAAGSLAVGMDMLPVVMAATAGLCAVWIREGDRWRTALTLYGITIGIGAALLLLATISPSRWLMPACDQISIVYVLITAFGGFGAALAAQVLGGDREDGAPGLVARGGALIGLGFMLISLTALRYPECLAGPYGAADPALGAIWLDHVGEVRGILSAGAERGWMMIASYAAPMVAVGAGIWLLSRLNETDRLAFFMLAGVLLSLLIVALWQRPALVTTHAIGSAVGGIVTAAVWGLVSARKGPRALAARCVWLLFAPLVWQFAGAPFAVDVLASEAESQNAQIDVCRAETAAALGQAPPGLVVAPTSSGAFLLAMTHHSVLAAPYPRNGTGIQASERILTATDAKDAFDEEGGRYISLCKSDLETRRYLERAPGGLVAQLIAGKRPGWLMPMLDTPNTLLLRRADALPAIADEITGSLREPQLRPSFGLETIGAGSRTPE